MTGVLVVVVWAAMIELVGEDDVLGLCGLCGLCGRIWLLSGLRDWSW